jgi:hypothetical protein
MAQATPAPQGATNRMVQAPGGRLHVTDHPGYGCTAGMIGMAWQPV